MGRAYQNRKDSMAKTSDMKARIYSRHARELYVSAKSGELTRKVICHCAA